MTASRTTKPSFRITILLCVPAAVYLFSYVYLAFYHRNLWLWNVVVHEGGTLTLLQTIFYATHFLGHVPSLIVISLLLAGSGLMLVPMPEGKIGSPLRLSVALIAFLIGSGVIAVLVFGWDDLLAYLVQAKQGTSIYERGGSWNLHLPSTIALFALIPPYVSVVSRLSRARVSRHRSGGYLVAAAAVLCFAFTLLFNRGSLVPFVAVFTDPRYLAHSVRELATFPLTFFPLPLYVLLRSFPAKSSLPQTVSKRIPRGIVISAVIGAAVLIYQCYIPLTVGIGQLAQKPSFAQHGTLGVPYLLASHYFEHVLDTVFFTLLTLLIWSILSRRR